MATTAKSTSTNSTRTSKPKQATSAPRSDTSQVREGVTKARHGAVSIVRQGAERVVDLPVGAALTLRDRVEDVLEPWTTESTRERELKSLRTQVTRELNRSSAAVARPAVRRPSAPVRRAIALSARSRPGAATSRRACVRTGARPRRRSRRRGPSCRSAFRSFRSAA